MNTIIPSTHFRGLIAKALVSAVAASFTVVCTAADNTETVSVVVKYGDLNVSNPEGAATLYRRIAAAASTVCGPYETDSWRRGSSPASVNACVHKAIADAVTKVGQPQLVAIYNAKNREPLPITVAAAKTH